jgi:hypothetical protein
MSAPRCSRFGDFNHIECCKRTSCWNYVAPEPSCSTSAAKSPESNVWWVLTWDNYYPSGELGNVHSTHATEEAANAVADEIRSRERFGYPYSRPDNIKVVDVTPWLNGEQPKVIP